MATALGQLRFRAGRYPTLAFLLLFPLLLALGFWQLDRAGQKQALLDAQQARSTGVPVDLQLLSAVTGEDRFRPAVARGHFVPGRQWLQDNRVHAGQAGYHVYSLFEFSAAPGHGVLVNRGWVPLGASRDELPVLPLPQGELEIRGRLNRPASVAIALGDPDYVGMGGLLRLPYLDVEKLGQAIDWQLLPLALELDAGQPGELTPDPVTATQIGPEKHVGYAVQWFGLAVALLIIYVGLNTRREK
jgi:cytochrome oxidase assembly protein ShyY1